MRLETPRLLLRPMDWGDVDALLEIFGDPRVMAAFHVAPFDRSQMEAWVRRNLAHQEAHGYGLCSVVLKETGRLIGDCGLELMVIDGVPLAELGYDFRSDCWNRGFATEAAAAARDHAFETIGLRQLVSLIRTDNGASRRVAEKLGMHEVREIHPHGRPYALYAVERRPELPRARRS